MPDGYGVEPGQLNEVAKQYSAEGLAIIKSTQQIISGVGPGQTGREFPEVAAIYQGHLEQYRAHIDTFGKAADDVAGRLTDVATRYSETEQANADSLRG